MELNELEQLIKQLKSVLSQAETVLGTPTSETTSIPQNNIESTLDSTKREYTIVTGLWNLKRNEELNDGRNFTDHYLTMFDEFLKMPMNLFIYVPKELEEFVRSRRSEKNTFIKILELDELKNNLYQPFWDRTQSIRTSEEWLNITGEGGWLKNSPQAKLEWYNPVVQSKMFMLHDACVWDPFESTHFYWLDAGIINTVPSTHFKENLSLDNIIKTTEDWVFLSWPYEAQDEIHGFKFDKMNEYSGRKVEYVCRGGFFGGNKLQLRKANDLYYSLLDRSLHEGLMGTEESIFAIMANLFPEQYRRYMLDDNGLIVKFTQALIDDQVNIEPIPEFALRRKKDILDYALDTIKTNLYILTFNFPEQLTHTIDSMKKVPEWLNKPHKVLLDNSTKDEAKIKNQEIAAEYNFEYISLEGNTGICGGRQAAAEHFDKSDADYYFFFEDDMTSNPPEEEGKFCRNGLRKFIPNLYDIVHKVMIKEKFDYLKMSFTEVYWDNDIQTSWYNVPQEVRTEHWPEYDLLPVNGSDPNAPRTQFNKIHSEDEVAYIDGEVTYTNWPMIMSKEGNRKVFLDTKWEHPFEQTWMSYVYQEQKKGNITAAVLLASPIWHERIKYYEPEERREN
tara:strand:- start:198 stop:2054 length:1857 start_codon:yes stop_codon:yes gene_type:complete